MTIPTDHESPVSSMEAKAAAEAEVLKIWADIFDLDAPDLDDDFFELGGDSVIAELLSGQIKESFGVEFKPSQIVACNSPRKIAAAIAASEAGVALPTNVMAVNADADGEPLFVFHGGTGFVFVHSDYIAALGRRRPVYIFQAPGFDGASEALHRFEELASQYFRTMIELSPTGPWNLLSFCAGGWIVERITRLMAEEGLKPERIILADIPLPPKVRTDRRSANLKLLTRFKFSLRTGYFVDGDDSRNMGNPEIEKYLVQRMMRRNEKRQKRSLERLRKQRANTGIGGDHDEAVLSIAKNYNSEAASLVSVRLQRAFREYDPQILDFPVSIIANRKRSQALKDDKHPFARLLPRRSNEYVGDYQDTALQTIETARFIGKILDTPPAANHGLDEREKS